MTTISPGPRSATDIIAGVDLSNAQHHAIKQVNRYAELAVDGDLPWGIVQDAPAQWEHAQLVPHGWSYVRLGEDCFADQMLGPLADGRLGPSSTTPFVRSTEAGLAGELVLGWVDIGSGGGGGLTAPQVTTLINQAKSSESIISNTANNTPPVQADWPGGIPTTNDLLTLLKPGNLQEHWQWNGTDFGVAPVRISTGGTPEATYAIAQAGADPLLDTLTAPALLALIQTDPNYAPAALNDGDNIQVTVDGSIERWYEVVGGVAVSKTVQAGAAKRDPEPLPVNAHGLTAGTMTRPVMVKDNGDGTYSLATGNDVGAEIFYAIGVGVQDANTLLVHRLSVVNSLPECDWPSDLPLNEYLWLQPDGTIHEDDPSVKPGHVNAVRILQVSRTDPRKFDFAYEVQTSGAGGGTDTRSVPRYSEFVADVEIPADTPINTNAATGGLTSVIDAATAYTSHSTGTDAASFNALYPETFLALLDEDGVPQQDVVYRNPADPAGFVRFTQIIPIGTRITFRTNLVETV